MHTRKTYSHAKQFHALNPHNSKIAKTLIKYKKIGYITSRFAALLSSTTKLSSPIRDKMPSAFTESREPTA